jgi:putative membrane protein
VLIVWQKALHLISVIVWFAGLFYMFRLFAYHTENADKPEVVEVLKTMENRLYRAIITPSLIATFFLGLWMIADNPGYLSKGWFRVKLVLVFGLAGYHGYMGRVRRRYSADDRWRPNCAHELSSTPSASPRYQPSRLRGRPTRRPAGTPPGTAEDKRN